MELSTMEELEKVIKKAVELDEPLGLFIQMPGFEKPELITNPVVNLEKKLQYYKDTYNDNLEHKHAKGIKIVAWVYS